MDGHDRLLTVPIVAKKLNCDPKTVRDWFDRGFLTGKEIPNPQRRTIRIWQSSVQRFLDE